MRNLLEYPITPNEVIDFLNTSVLIESTIIEVTGECGSIDPLCAKIALQVVNAASTIVQNDIGSSAADLLSKAFQSQDIPVRETA